MLVPALALLLAVHDDDIETVSLPLSSHVLVGNPLKDPVDRTVFVIRPKVSGKAKLPLVLYLPGFGGSSEDVAKHSAPWEDMVRRLHQAKVDVVFAVVDGRNRYGCSQYINSASSGPYLDYECDEIVPFVEKTFRCGGRASNRLVAGHSSGGFGALRVGMAKPNEFGGVIALSPDSYFDVTHKPLTLDPSTKKVSATAIAKMGPPELGPLDGLEGEAGYCLALCADYAPKADGSGQFEWIYDSQGNYRDEVYNQWLDNDPAVLAERSKHPFARGQRVYLDGAAEDDFKANLGAQKVADNLKGKHVNFTLNFPPGHHSDHLWERIERGIRWVLHAPLFEIH